MTFFITTVILGSIFTLIIVGINAAFAADKKRSAQIAEACAKIEIANEARLNALNIVDEAMPYRTSGKIDNDYETKSLIPTLPLPHAIIDWYGPSTVFHKNAVVSKCPACTRELQFPEIKVCDCDQEPKLHFHCLCECACIWIMLTAIK